MGRHPEMRDQAGRFLPGQSGNPGGRPRGGYELREMSRRLAPRILEVMFEIACDPAQPGAVRVRAGNSVLDRGYGRPGRAEHPKVPEHLDLAHMTDAQIMELIADNSEQIQAEL